MCTVTNQFNRRLKKLAKTTYFEINGRCIPESAKKKTALLFLLSPTWIHPHEIRAELLWHTLAEIIPLLSVWLGGTRPSDIQPVFVRSFVHSLQVQQRLSLFFFFSSSFFHYYFFFFSCGALKSAPAVWRHLQEEDVRLARADSCLFSCCATRRSETPAFKSCPTLNNGGFTSIVNCGLLLWSSPCLLLVFTLCLLVLPSCWWPVFNEFPAFLNGWSHPLGTDFWGSSLLKGGEGGMQCPKPEPQYHHPI